MKTTAQQSVILSKKWRRTNMPGVNLSIDSSPAVSKVGHLLGVFGQHHVAAVKRPRHLAVPVVGFGQLTFHAGQNILLLVQVCSHGLYTNTIPVGQQANVTRSTLIF